MTSGFIITLLTYVVAGALPPLIAVYLLNVSFLGGVWGGSLVGVVAAVIGGLLDTIVLTMVPDLIVLAGAVDVVPPLVTSIIVTTLFGLVSSSNG